MSRPTDTNVNSDGVTFVMLYALLLVSVANIYGLLDQIND